MKYLNDKQESLLNARVESLKADGFFQPESRDMAGDDPTGTRYLIVSYGGTGAKALMGVKKKFEKIIPSSQLEARVRFLAIDTDNKTQVDTHTIENEEGKKVTEEYKVLKDSQFLQLRGTPARSLFNGVELPESVRQWISPSLVELLRSDVTKGEQGTYLKDTGASGIRQIGRISLWPSETISLMKTRIQDLVRQITVGKKAPLRVIILTGIAGGTGSGTVIDLTYLIRDIISNMPGSVGDNTEYLGFVMLPSTGSSKNPDDITHGNRNGYAALKEINHYMTLQQRNKSIEDHDKREQYTFTYGDGYTVSSDSDIFSICFLMDGVSGGVVHENPIAQVSKVIAEGLLDIVTANQIENANGKGLQCLDSFMNDAETFRTEMLGKANPKAKAPRDADYVYCALGHDEFSIPTHMLKTYIAKKLLDHIYENFAKCSNAEESDAKEFVKKVARQGGNDSEEVRDKMLALLRPIMEDFNSQKAGPWYVINLLYAVCNKVIPDLKRAWFPGISKDMLEFINDAAGELNSKFFTAFVASLEALKAMLAEQYKTVISTTPQGNVYHFMPMALNDLEQTSAINAVVQRLGFFARREAFEDVYKDLINEVWTQKGAWSGFLGDVTKSNNTITTMRRFWNTRLDKLLRNHLQDMLVRYFAKDPKATFDPKNPKTMEYLRAAAETIYDYMLGAAGLAQPMLDITGTGMTTDDMKGHTYLMVPKEAEQLIEALEEVATSRKLAGGDEVRICSSHSSDTIACYRQFTSIPAFKLSWTQRAESEYEKGILTEVGMGMHMSQSVGGKRWANFPNLLPKSTWSLTAVPHKNAREEAMAQKAVDLFNKAQSIPGMASYVMEGEIKQYSVAILPEAYRPSDVLYKRLDNADADQKADILREIDQAAAQLAAQLAQLNYTDANRIIPALQEQGIACEYQSLNVAPMLSYHPAGETPADWYEFVAGTMLRKLPDVMHALDGSLRVVEALSALVKSKLHENVQYAQFFKYLAAGLFVEDVDDGAWKYENSMGIKKLLLRTGNKLVDAAPFFFMYQAYREKEADVEEALAKMYNKDYALPENDEDAEYTPKFKALRASGEALLTVINAWITADPHCLDSDSMKDLAAKKDVTLDQIHAFYRKLQTSATHFADGEFSL